MLNRKVQKLDDMYSLCIGPMWHRAYTQRIHVVQLCGPVFAARCYASAAYESMRCPSVCLSRSYILSKRINIIIFKFLSPSGSHIILVFPYQTAWQYSDGNPLTGHQVQLEYAEIAILSQYRASLHAVNAATARCYQHDCRPISIDDCCS